MSLATAMLSVIATWVLILPLFLGIGISVRRLAGLGKLTLDRMFLSFWIGWGTTVLFLQILNFFKALGVGAFSAFALAGLFGLFWNRTAIWGFLASLLRDGSRLRVATWLVVVSLLALVLGNQAIGPSHNFDTGLYHLQGVRWATSHPVVPGLGHANFRLSFNNSSFLYMAMLEIGPWYGLSRHVGNGLLGLVLMLQLALSARRILSAESSCWPRDLTMATLLAPTSALLIVNGSSASPDLPAVALTIVLAGLGFTASSGERGDDEVGERLLAAGFLAAIALSVKVSTAVFSVATVCVVLACHRRDVGRWGRAMAVALLMAGATVATWAARGVVMTGYPAFPSAVAPMPVDWRMGEDRVRFWNDIIRSWARKPGRPVAEVQEVLADWQWLGPWLRDQWARELEFRTPVMLFAVAIVLSLVGLARVGRSPPAWRSFLGLFAPLAGLVFWFFSAPDVRFTNGCLWILAAGQLSVALDLFRARGSRLTDALGISPAAVWLSVLYALRLFAGHPHGPGANSGFHEIPEAQTRPMEIETGLVVHVVLPEGRQQCWDSPLPCAPFVLPALRLRHAGDLARGFRGEAEGSEGR